MHAYWDRGTLSFAIPAHGGARRVAPEFTRWAGEDAARFDLPLSHGVDRRDRAWGVQKAAQDLFADAAGARQVMFSTNGSSMNVHVALLTVAGEHGKIVMARNGHKSQFAGLVLSGAVPVYVDPVYDEDLELAHVPTAEAVAAALREHPDARGVLITTPSYYGTNADVAAIAAACHAVDRPLITDDAWGLDYGFARHPDLPPPALSQGSDLAIGSVHKTLSGLSQTSVLSVGSDRIDPERLQLCFELQESTSVSALLLSSIDGARRQFVREGHELLHHAVELAHRFRERMAEEVPELPVVPVDRMRAVPGVDGVDPTHLLIETAAVGLTGYQAEDWLMDHHAITAELQDHRRIMALLSYAHGREDVDRLVDALRDLVDHEGGEPLERRFPSRPELRTETAMRPRDAFFAAVEHVAPDDAVGRVSAELVTPYPPGIPAMAPGEVITEELVGYVEEVVALGGFLEGAADQQLDTFRVVA
jgi:arginine decarboxylase